MLLASSCSRARDHCGHRAPERVGRDRDQDETAVSVPFLVLALFLFLVVCLVPDHAPFLSPFLSLDH